MRPRGRRAARLVLELLAPALLVALVLLVLLAPAATRGADQPVTAFLSGPARSSRVVELPLRLITLLSAPVVVGAIGLIGAANLGRGRLLRSRHRRSWVSWAFEWGSAAAPLWGPPVGIALVVLLTSAVRLWLATLLTRPGPSLADAVVAAASSAFPDVHTTTAVAVAGSLLIAYGNRRRGAWALTWFTLVVVGLAQVGIGAYDLSDVLAGAALGATVVLLGRRTGLLTDGPLLWRIVRSWNGRDRPAVVSPAAVVFNPTKFADIEAFKRRVEAGLGSRADGSGVSWRVTFHETAADDSGHAATRAALAAGARLLVAAGGDGTVRTVCTEAAGSGVPVGVIPSGTSNLLARNLRLPLQEGPALDAVMAGTSRLLDSATVSGDGLPADGFVVMAGLGFDGAIMADVPRRLKKVLGLSAYVVTGARHLLDEAVRVEVTIDDDEVLVRHARTVIVGNVGSLQVLNLLPGAVPDDGLLNVIVVAPRRNRAMIRVFWRLVRMQGTSDEEIEWRTARTVRIRADHAMPRQLDGDAIAAGRTLDIGIRPSTLEIRVPNRH